MKNGKIAVPYALALLVQDQLRESIIRGYGNRDVFTKYNQLINAELLRSFDIDFLVKFISDLTIDDENQEIQNLIDHLLPNTREHMETIDDRRDLCNKVRALLINLFIEKYHWNIAQSKVPPSDLGKSISLMPMSL